MALGKPTSVPLDRAGVQYTTREYLSGHRLPGQDSSYLRLSEEDRLVEYRKAMDLLTISSEGKLRQQIQNKESDVKFIQSEISSLKRCVNHMISMMKHIRRINLHFLIISLE